MDTINFNLILFKNAKKNADENLPLLIRNCIDTEYLEDEKNWDRFDFKSISELWHGFSFNLDVLKSPKQGNLDEQHFQMESAR